MGATAKISIAIGREELAWVKKRAKRARTSVSAVISEAIAERRRFEALQDVVDWALADQPALTESELAAVRRELRSRKK